MVINEYQEQIRMHNKSSLQKRKPYLQPHPKPAVLALF